MNPEQWERVQDLFHRALELEPEQRTAFLDDVAKRQYMGHLRRKAKEAAKSIRRHAAHE